MTKILVIIGTLPEAIKLFPVVRALLDDLQFNCVVCTTGQHREMVDDVLDFAGVVPDYQLDAMRAGQSLAALTAQQLIAAEFASATSTQDCEQAIIIRCGLKRPIEK